MNEADRQVKEGRPRIVLIHGASHGAWCWKLLIPLLEAGGCDVKAPDLPGLGKDGTDPSTVSFADYVACVVGTLGADRRAALLVGHSLGGGPISRAAEEVPEQVSGLVYLAAMLPQPGETMLNCFQGEDGADVPPMRETEHPGMFEFAPEQARDLLYARCDPKIADEAVGKLRPQPLAPANEPIVLTSDRWGRVPKSYIICVDDGVVAAKTQRWLSSRIADISLHYLDADHSPFFSDPEALANILINEAKLRMLQNIKSVV